MLSEAEQLEIEAEARHYPARRAVAIDALKIVQRHRGYISDETLGEVAEFLGLSPDELDGVASFYNLLHRRPVGRHVIWICDGVSCWLTGYNRLRRKLQADLEIEMGQTTTDGRFTLLPIVCLGACDHAPVCMVDDDLHADLDPDLHPERAGEMLARYR